MRARTLILLLVALSLAGGTGMLMRSWPAQRRTAEAEAAPMPPPAQKSILVARGAITRGQILKPADVAWQIWPDAGVDRAYIQKGAKTIEDFVRLGGARPRSRRAGHRKQDGGAWQPWLSRGRAVPRHARRVGAGHPHLGSCFPATRSIF